MFAVPYFDQRQVLACRFLCCDGFHEALKTCLSRYTTSLPIFVARCRGAAGAPSGSETGQDLVHFVQVLAVQSNCQTLEQGGLLGG